MTTRADGIKFTATTTGVADFGIGTASAGFRLPSDVPLADGDEVDYIAFTDTERATGRGTYHTAGTISRDDENPIAGATSGGKINFATAPTVAIAPIAESFADVAFSGLAEDVAFTPTGGISADDVAAALAELDSEKLSTAAAAAAYQPLDSDLTTWAGLTPSANAQSLVTAADYAAMRALLDLEAGTDFYSKSGADAAFQPLDSDLTSIAGLSTTSYGRSLLTLADEDALEALLDTLPNLTSIQGRTVTLADAGFDVLAGWDDSVGAYKNFLLADIAAEVAPASGDCFLIYGAEGDLRKVDFDDMPTGGGSQTPWESDIDAGGFSLLFADDTGILDADGNPLLLFEGDPDAVNYIGVSNSATETWPNFFAAGTDTDIGINFLVKGDAAVNFVSDNPANTEMVASFAPGDEGNFAEFVVSSDGFISLGTGGADIEFRPLNGDTPSLKASGVEDALNYIGITNAATGDGPDLSAVGDDDDIDLILSSKGEGLVWVGTDEFAYARFGKSGYGSGAVYLTNDSGEFSDENIIFGGVFGGPIVGKPTGDSIGITGDIGFGRSARLNAGMSLAWNSGDNQGSGADTGLSRLEAGVVKVRGGDSDAGCILYDGNTYDNRPSSPIAGMVCYFTDSTTGTPGATIAGTGSTKVLGWYNGSNWTVIGA